MERSRFPKLFASLAALTVLAGMVIVGTAFTGAGRASADQGPPITVDAVGDNVSSGANDWSIGGATEVSITVARGGDPTGQWTAPLGDYGHFGTFVPFDVQVGDDVTVDNLHGYLTTHTVIGITAEFAANQTVTGTAPIDGQVTVTARVPDGSISCTQTVPATGGIWLADFSGCGTPVSPFAFGDPWTNARPTSGEARYVAIDGNTEATNWSAGSNAFTADATTDQVSSVGGCPTGWGTGSCGSITGWVDIQVWRGGDPNTGQSVFGPQSYPLQPYGHFYASLTGFDLLPGDIVRVSDGVHPTKQLTVSSGFTVTTIDVTAHTVTGTASPDGATIIVDANNFEQSCRRTTTVASGHFTADFSTGCSPAFDFVVGDPWSPSAQPTWGSAYLLDDDYDATRTDWSLALPVFQASADQDSVSSGGPGCRWGTGSCGSNTGTIQLTITRGGAQVFPATGTASAPILAFGNWNFNLVDAPYNPSPWKFDVRVGDEITVTDGTHTKTLVLTSIRSFGADPSTDRVYGQADPAAGNVTAFVYSNGPATCNRVDATFDGSTWTADFSEPDCYDITPSGAGSAQQTDADGDATATNWQVPSFSVNPQPDQVTGSGWGPGNTVTVTITPVGGTTRAYTVVVPTTTSQYMMPGSFQLCTNQGNPAFCTMIGTPALDIEPGATVTISHLLPNGTSLSSTHVVTALMITGVDAVNNVVRGIATPGIDVLVTAQPNQPGIQPEPHTVAPISGAWSQTFTMDIVAPPTNPSTFISASQVDPATNNRTQVFWGWGQPQILLTPSTNFADDTVVTVQGVGWAPGATISIGQCRYPTSGTQDCAPANAVVTVADSNFGDFTAQITIEDEIVTAGGQTVDCTGGFPYCALGVSTGGPNPQYQIRPLVFGTPGAPHLTVAPSNDLHDGDLVTVHLTGYPRNAYVNIGQCTNSIQVPYYPGFCVTNQVDPTQTTTTDANGELVIQVRATRFLVNAAGYTVTPSANLVDGQNVTVEGHGYRVADCTTAEAACYFQAVIFQGGPVIAAPPVAMDFAPSVAAPTLDVRQNFLGHVQGGEPPNGYSYVMWANETAGAVQVALVDEGNGGWGFTTEYTVHRSLTVAPAPPYAPSLDTLTNPIDCATLPTGLPEGNEASCIIDVFPHGYAFPLDYVMNAQRLQFGDTDGIPAAVEDGAPNGGDGNDDGVLDSQQGNVASLPGALDVDGNGLLDDYVTIESPDGTWLSYVSITDTTGLPGTPAGVSFPVGLLDFTVNGVTTPDSFDVAVFLPGGLLPAEYWKYQGGEWSNYTAHTNLPGHNPVKLTLQDRTDGQDGSGDDNVATGVVHDPGGPAVWAKSGYLNTVANPPAVNTVKAGSVVVLKFSLGGNRGLNILAAGYPASAQVTACGANVAAGVELTPTIASKALAYSTKTQEYQYLWQIPRNWKGTCRQLVLKFADGTFMVANFQFK